MLLFAVETTGEIASFAVWDASIGIERAELKVRAYQDLTRLIPQFVGTVLTQAKVTLADIDLMAVSLGPGFFTSIRVGVAFVKGLAVALEKPMVGVRTMEALSLAATAPDGCLLATCYPSRPSRPTEVFGALFRVTKEIPFRDGDEFVCDFSRLVDRLLQRPEEVVGLCGVFPEGTEAQLTALREGKKLFLPFFPQRPTATLIARRAWQRWQERPEPDDPLTVLPIYVLPSYAEEKRR